MLLQQLSPLPPLLLKQAEKACQHLKMLLADTSLQQQSVLAFSHFITENFLREPGWWHHLQMSPPDPDEWQYYQQWLNHKLLTVSDEQMLMRELRRFRRWIQVRIGWMQTLSISRTEQTLHQLSVLAEILIIAARDWLFSLCCRESGTPCNESGEAQPLLILGMGKLGGGELNFSSDIDLIFIYPEKGCTRGGRREQDNAQFFTRLGQRLIKVLDQVTEEGVVYRVDMRLRPFGDSGPLVLSFAALEAYYQEQGRDWERYAMVKARLMGSGDELWVQQLHQILRPFTYRRYIDFSVIQSLRKMKGMIEREVRRRGLRENIKLGEGGIREIEFVVQVLQLIRGGREPGLQLRALLPALKAVDSLKLLPAIQVRQLRDAYLFLRRLENLLQSIAGQQTQTLPEDELNRARLAWAMGCDDWQILYAKLIQHRTAVRQIFDQLAGEETALQQAQPDYGIVWQDTPDEAELALLVPHLDASGRRQLLREITAFRHDLNKRTIGPRGRDALEQLMPRLLSEICIRNDAVLIFTRLIPLLLSVVMRSTYLELLTEYPAAMQHLIRLCAASPMLASQLARHPLLLDELLNPLTLYHPVEKGDYRDELRQFLLRIAQDDEEQQLEGVRQFKQAQQLHIAAADISNRLSVLQASDHLTWLAEAIIESVVQHAWQIMVLRYGRPSHLLHEDARGFAVVGYGKLGGWELGYNSDLDLVFLHDCPAAVMTTGESRIDGRQFYLRLAHRILHLFSTRTASGVLYEVDTRLRPSGAAGMLVSSIEAFAEYQRDEAWLWEHQALVRARVVYGEILLRERFTALRCAILCLPRPEEQLKKEVRDMRQKMLAHLGNKHQGRWDVKTDAGGIIDIEFITQYLVLRHAIQQPELVRWTDNVRILTLLSRFQLLDESFAEILTCAYITLRNTIHHLTLQALPAHVDQQELIQIRSQVMAVWRHLLEAV